jgi:DNA polymerase sigma
MNYNSMLFPTSKAEQPDDLNSPYSTNIMSKIEGDIYPFIFHYRIHNDILEYSNSVTQVINYLKDIKLYIIKYLEKSIKKALSCDLEIDLYGSFATDLSIESSDIDITIKFADDRKEVEIVEVIEALCANFRGLCLFETINPILTASVPVIKILVDPMKILEPDSPEMKQFCNFKNTEIFKNYKFDKEELLKIKVDLTFIELNRQQGKAQSTRSSLDWARKTLISHPEIKPIIHVLKRYLQIKKLNSSFNGGLSSFSLFLLIVAYIKYPKIKTRINLGRVLMEMLELFGKCFQFAQSIIDVNSVR